MMRKKTKIVYTIFTVSILILLYGTIFSFSAQDGEASGGLSLKISKLGMELWNEITGSGWTDNFSLQMAEYFEHPIRKIAHFTEYAVMGVLIYSLFLCWEKIKKRWMGFSLLWVALSAAADEFHQYFIPGRYSSILDVLLDSCGGAFGILLCLFIYHMRQKRKKKKSCEVLN